ncbi:MAG: hypothetical protein KDD35_02265, partial [Bdellovibrionales bacterium]|nr:hypothetical protein [Bdellovibrionales bacterium]
GRSNLHLLMSKALEYALYLTWIVNPEDVYPEELTDLIRDLAADPGPPQNPHEVADRLSSLTTTAMLSFRPQQVKDFIERAKSHRKAASRGDRDSFNLPNWETAFFELRSEAEKQLARAETLTSQARLDQQTRMQQWEQALTSNNFTRLWKSTAGREPPKDPIPDKPHWNPTDAQLWTRVAIGLGAYITGAYALDTEMAQQVFCLNWIYENLYFPVLRDPNYRSTLVIHLTIMSSLIPLAVMSSIGVGNFLNLIAEKTQNLSDPFVGKVRDAAKRWGNLGGWQRLITSGIRVMAMVVPSFAGRLVRFGGAPGFVQAITEGINPFERITPNSPVGRHLNLQKPTFVGFQRPQRQWWKLSPASEKLIEAVSERDRRASVLESWYLARNLGYFTSPG